MDRITLHFCVWRCCSAAPWPATSSVSKFSLAFSFILLFTAALMETSGSESSVSSSRPVWDAKAVMQARDYVVDDDTLATLSRPLRDKGYVYENPWPTWFTPPHTSPGESYPLGPPLASQTSQNISLRVERAWRAFRAKNYSSRCFFLGRTPVQLVASRNSQCSTQTGIS